MNGKSNLTADESMGLRYSLFERVSVEVFVTLDPALTRLARSTELSMAELVLLWNVFSGVTRLECVHAGEEGESKGKFWSGM